MIYDLKIWLAASILALPIVVLGLAWAGSSRFYGRHPIPKRQRIVYRVALLAASLSTLAYLGYWGWRVCGLYRIMLPSPALLVIEGSLNLSKLLSAVAIVCFLIGRGPYRVSAILTTLWVTLQIWLHGGIIHWA